jgi:hypothetical protein
MMMTKKTKKKKKKTKKKKKKTKKKEHGKPPRQTTMYSRKICQLVVEHPAYWYLASALSGLASLSFENGGLAI